MPEDLLLQKLEESIAELRITGSEESRMKVGINCLMFTTKQTIGDNDPMDFIDDLDKTERAKDLLSPTSN